MSQFPSVIQLSDIDGTNGFKISGAADFDLSGWSVASAGDLNGDGFADLIIGAPDASANGFESGASYVVYGSLSGVGADLDLSSLNGTNGFRIAGAASGDAFGYSVASAGDVNGDGLPDLIIGAPRALPHGLTTGASYVVFGQASGFAPNLGVASLNGSNGFRISGDYSGDNSGYSVSSAGDVNGDGFDDLIVGAPHGDFSVPYDSRPDAGFSYVVFGEASGFSANLDVSTLDAIHGGLGFELYGASASERSGSSVASAGDVNGDGYADLIIGAPNSSASAHYAGAAYVVFGAPALATGFAVDLAGLDGTSGFEILGLAAGDHLGVGVASAGDINGDGFADVIVSADRAGPGGRTYAGSSFVVFGKASGFGATVDLTALDGSNGFRIDGASAYSISGHSVASAGDVNGDGFDDLVIGAPRESSQQGASYVVFGRASGFGPTLQLSDLDGATTGFKIGGAHPGDYNGQSVSSAGDVNGDGLADLVIGEKTANAYGLYAGASYVVYGRLPDTAVNRTGTDASQSLVGGNFNDTLSGLGGDDKLSGNGGDDVLNGGAGTDTASYGAAASGVSVSLAVAGPQDTLGAGTDTLTSIEILIGSSFNDMLSAAATGSPLHGGNGDDVLVSGAGADALDGGAGSDTASYAAAGTGVSVSLVLAGGPQDTHGAGTDSLLGIENLTGSSHGDHLTGNAGANVLSGGGGNDVLIGGVVVDGLDGGSGTDVATYAGTGSAVSVSLAIAGGQDTLGAGIDTLTSIETLIGTDFADTLTAAATGSTIKGGLGDDLILSGAGNDTLIAGSGTDTVSYAGAGSGVTVKLAPGAQNTVGAGTDTLSGFENLTGSGFGDTLTGSSADNVLHGGGGDDVLRGGGGNDTLDGGTGSDTASYAGAPSAVTVSLAVRDPEDTLGAGTDTFVSIENLTGSSFDDTLTAGSSGSTLNGGAGADVLIGGAGTDTLNGGAGDDSLIGVTGSDTLNGGAGNDSLFAASGNQTLNGGVGNDVLIGSGGANTLNGGAGTDTLTGGAGPDVFVFVALGDSKTNTPDLITDFAAGDHIDLHLIDANTAAGGNQAFHLGATPGHTGDAVVTYDAGANRTSIILYVDANANADSVIWLSGDHHDLTAADFIL